MKVEDLPDELKDLSPEERKARLDEAVKKRRELNAQLLELNRKRSEYISESEAKSNPPAPRLHLTRKSFALSTASCGRCDHPPSSRWMDCRDLVENK